jgi:hypothetical protein
MDSGSESLEGIRTITRLGGQVRSGLIGGWSKLVYLSIRLPLGAIDNL